MRPFSAPVVLAFRLCSPCAYVMVIPRYSPVNCRTPTNTCPRKYIPLHCTSTMALAIFCALLSLLATLTCASTDDRQAGLQDAHNKGTRIAIIGAGVSSASTAYHLREYLFPDQPLSITIFESSESIGGRVASFPVPDTQNKTILETGITGFFADDECMEQSAKELGLALNDGSGYWPLGQHREPTRTGVWDGTTITGRPLLIQRLREWLDKCGLLWLMEPVIWSHDMSIWDTLRLLHWSNWCLDPGVQASCELASPSFWRQMQLRFEYGKSPGLFRQALHTTDKRLRSFGKTGGYGNVAVELERVGLMGDVTSTSAAQYLTDIGVSKQFQSEVVEPCVRERCSLDLTQVRAMGAFMACKESKEMFIQGGNLRLVEAMINTSQADMQLRSEVVGIEHGQDRRYKLSIADAPGSMSHRYREFDLVVLTGPLHGSPMLNSLAKLRSLPESFLSPPNHVATHVTYFATEHGFNPQYLNLSVDSEIPDRLLTTSVESNLISFSKWDWMGYYWEDRLRRKKPWIARSDPEEYECANGRFHYEKLYRVVTRRYFSNRELAAMAGKSWDDGQDATDVVISWVHRQEWDKALPNFEDYDNVLGDIEIMEGLFWLDDVNEVMSSLEMSCKMGRNVASNIAYTQDQETSRRAHGEL